MEDSSFFCQLCFVFFFIHLSKNSRSLIVGVVGERKRGERRRERQSEVEGGEGHESREDRKRGEG